MSRAWPRLACNKSIPIASGLLAQSNHIAVSVNVVNEIGGRTGVSSAAGHNALVLLTCLSRQVLSNTDAVDEGGRAPLEAAAIFLLYENSTMMKEGEEGKNQMSPTS